MRSLHIAGRYCLAFPLLGSVFLSSCSRDESYYPLPEIDYLLAVTDSIGVELGDEEYMFAWATDPTYAPDGRIFIVDRMKHAVFVYSRDGEYMTTVGREGEGPGEFRLPASVEFFPDGSYMVCDADGISYFDSSSSYTGQTIWDGFHPWIREALDDGSMIGNLARLSPSEDRIVFEHILGRWEKGDQEASVVYETFLNEWNMSSPGTIDHTDHRESVLTYCASANGRVFYSRSAIDDLEIHCCEPDGSEFLLIEEDITRRVRKTEAELEDEMNSVRSWASTIRRNAGRSDSDIDIILDPYRRTIQGMFVDGDERLWVSMGIYPGIVFRVYDLEGNVLFHAMVDYRGDQLDLNDWEISGDRYGFLAVNTSMEYCQRVYILELVETVE